MRENRFRLAGCGEFYKVGFVHPIPGDCAPGTGEEVGVTSRGCWCGCPESPCSRPRLGCHCLSLSGALVASRGRWARAGLGARAVGTEDGHMWPIRSGALKQETQSRGPSHPLPGRPWLGTSLHWASVSFFPFLLWNYWGDSG